MQNIAATAATVSILLLGNSIASATATNEGLRGTLSVTTTVTSDYRFRGQTDGGAAVQGDVTYSDVSGLFASLWASTIDLTGPQNVASEVEIEAGYSHEFSSTWHGGLTAAYYLYPAYGSTNDDYFEIIGGLSHNIDAVSLSGELAYSPNYFGGSGNALALTAGFDTPIPIFDIDWLSASAHAGYQWIAENAAYGTPDWFFYDLGLTAKWQHFAFGIGYTATDTSSAECFGGSNRCQGGLVLSLTANLQSQ